MITKIIKYSLLALVVLIAGVLIFSPDTRQQLALLISVGKQSSIELLEKRLDQGALALQRFDKEYTKAQQKLATLKSLKMDAQLSVRRAEEKSAEFRRLGKEELAARNAEQVSFFKAQLEGYDKSIASRSVKLMELKSMREKAREDVRLARERIAMLKATRDALDDEQQQQELERAQQNIYNLQSYCNRLTAEIEVINITD